MPPSNMAFTFARVAYSQRTGTAAQASSGGAAAGPQAGAQHPAGQDVSTECSVLDTPPDSPAVDA